MGNTIEKGIESLKESVRRDCAKAALQFSETGCGENKCSRCYCDKFKWIMDRAAHYAQHTGIPADQILKEWEEQRSYWYMNYYQDCNQPLLSGTVPIIPHAEWLADLKSKYGDDQNQWRFKCPSCGWIQCKQDFIDAGIELSGDQHMNNCIGRWVSDRGCDWSLGGLFQIHKTAVLWRGSVYPIFETAEKDESR